MTNDEEKNTRDQIVSNIGFDLKSISDRYDELNRSVTESYREDLKKAFRAGREVTEDQLRMAKMTRRDLEMMVKLDRMVEDPEKYFREVREEARRQANKEMREEILRPFKSVLDWILRRRNN